MYRRSQTVPTHRGPRAPPRTPVLFAMAVVAAVALCSWLPAPTVAAAAGTSANRAESPWCMHDAISARAGRFSPRVATTKLLRPSPEPTVVAASTAASSSKEGGAVASAVNWQPLRIKAFTADLEKREWYCAAEGQTVTDYTNGGTLTCRAEDVLTDAVRHLLVEHLLPAAIQLHEERLRVDRLSSINLSYPFGDFDSVCGRFNVPPSHFTDGVTGADYLLYVSATPMSGDGAGSLAWAKTCQTDASGRPVAGVLNVAPSFFATNSSDATVAAGGHGNLYHAVRTIAHELLHALGFDYALFEAKDMVGMVNLRSKVNVRGVDSPQTVAAARAHYGCPSMQIMELEDYGIVGSTSSHWKMRNAKDELMSSYTDTAGLYTALSIAAMEDLGFYKGNYDKAEGMAWGDGATCVLISNKCLINGVVQVSLTNPNTQDMFCTPAPSSSSSLSSSSSSSSSAFPSSVLAPGRCTSSRLAVGTCNVIQAAQPYPFYAQYFSDRFTGGSVAAMDFCPFILAEEGMTCEGGSVEQMPGSVFSQASRCLSAPPGSEGVEVLNSLEYLVDPVTGNGVWLPLHQQALCVDVRCNASEHTYAVRVRGSATFVDCPEGSSFFPTNYSASVFGSGQLQCPPFLQVCSGNTGATYGNPDDEVHGDTDSGVVVLNRLMVLLIVALVLAF